mmetsp:Transcript_94018/g.236920  ORF Transcript_94018/g.236920 Transcript_94018/m.236920 type:complete len:239 (-) Transcript_94018:1064-1780(-)
MDKEMATPCSQWLCVHIDDLHREAPAKGGNDLKNVMLWNGQIPCVLQSRPTKVGEKHLNASDVADAKHRPCRHLDFEQDALRPAHDIVVALPAREAAMQFVVLPSTVEARIALSNLLEGRLICTKVDPPRAAKAPTVDRVERRHRPEDLRSEVTARLEEGCDGLHATRHSGREHPDGLLGQLLSMVLPQPPPHECTQPLCEKDTLICEFGILGPCGRHLRRPYQPNGPRSNVDPHEVR